MTFKHKYNVRNSNNNNNNSSIPSVRQTTFSSPPPNSIVDSTHILTAAHCVEGSVMDIIVVAGTNFRSRRQNSRGRGAQIRFVAKIEIHSGYKEIKNAKVTLGMCITVIR